MKCPVVQKISGISQFRWKLPFYFYRRNYFVKSLTNNFDSIHSNFKATPEKIWSNYLNNKGINIHIRVVLDINMKQSRFSRCVHFFVQPWIKGRHISLANTLHAEAEMWLGDIFINSFITGRIQIWSDLIPSIQQNIPFRNATTDLDSSAVCHNLWLNRC